MELPKISNFDFKTWVILILGGALIISFFFGQGNNIDKNKEEIKKLHKENTLLLNRVDSLKQENTKLDLILLAIDSKLNENNKRIENSISILNDLKKKKNEIPTYVNSLSANGTTNEFTKYLETRTEGNNND